MDTGGESNGLYLLIIAPSGRHVCKRVRLAGAQAWQTERWHARNSVRGLTPQRSQMRYNNPPCTTYPFVNGYKAI